MAITLGDPITITSGQLSSPITRSNIKIDRLYWHQPNGTSGVVLRQFNLSGPIVAQLTCEVSGQSQTLELKRWVNSLYCEAVGAGTLYIHTR